MKVIRRYEKALEERWSVLQDQVEGALQVGRGLRSIVAVRRHRDDPLVEEVAALLPNGRIVHIAGAGHNVRREGKEETLAVLREFLGGL